MFINTKFHSRVETDASTKFLAQGHNKRTFGLISTLSL